MSYEIDEGLEDQRRKLKAYEAIAAHHPRARLDTLPGGEREWCDPDLAKPDRLFVSVDKDGNAWLCPYLLIEGMALFVDRWKWDRVDMTLSRLNGGAYQALVGAVMQR